MTEYLNNQDLGAAVNAVREMKAPKHFLPEMLSKMLVCSLDRSDQAREHASALINTLRTEGLVTGENFMQVLKLTPPLLYPFPLSALERMLCMLDTVECFDTHTLI